VFAVEESGFSQRQFKIFFSLEDKKYYIKDLCDTSGTFVRLDCRYAISSGNVFIFGNFSLKINYKSLQKTDPTATICIQVFEGDQPQKQM